MKKRIGLLLMPVILTGLFAIFSHGGWAAYSGQPEPEPDISKLEPSLETRLQERPDETVDVIVYMAEKADLQAHSLPQAPLARRTVVVQALRQTAQQSQAALLPSLDLLQQEGEISSYNSLWIINAVALSGSLEAIEALAARSDVSRIMLDSWEQYLEPEEAQIVAPAFPRPWGIEKIGAPYVWHGLGITGRGVTVAIMDSGVDWQHPVLYESYRGMQETGTVLHEGNWFDAVDNSNQEPFDPQGHGTHVAGTVAGQDDIGVAPGARWIAVRIFDDAGFTSLSIIHEGFQWLLAPGGDPALAPDVMNGSWGGSGHLDIFAEDVQALHAAGIITVFATGNDGPETGTIAAPAAFAGTIAVAASDSEDRVAWFSSSGPSIFAEHKPDLVAPGTHVLSSLPDNSYGYYVGTSMAAPHTTGVVALLLEANPTLERLGVAQGITSTTRAISTTHPNIRSGWGRLDAYAAVGNQLGGTGRLQGVIRGNGLPLPGVTLTVTTQAGIQLPFTTDNEGRYNLEVRPGIYHLVTAPFGYHPLTLSPVEVEAAKITAVDLSLTHLPGSLVSGRVRAAGGGSPLKATIDVLGIPLTTTAGPDGRYEIFLPEGVYTLRASRTGYRIQEREVTVVDNVPLERAFHLQPAPSILLVDSGAWYYASQRAMYSAALLTLGFAFDEWSITSPVDGAPDLATLHQYDLVIWSSPLDSPGIVSAGTILSEFLDTGGTLLISGQNIAQADGSGYVMLDWWYRLIQGIYMINITPPFTLTETTSPLFSGLALALNGPDSANNQTSPDVVTLREGSLTEPVLQYADGSTAALHAGWCQPFNAIYMGFGLEGIAGAENRAELLNRAILKLTDPQPRRGLHVTPTTVERFVVPGQTVTTTVDLKSLDEATAHIVDVNVDAQGWDVRVGTPRLFLAPCEGQSTTITVTVPTTVPEDFLQTIQVSIKMDNGESSTLSLSLKTPGDILVVDDDRWYDQEATYRAALDESGIPYDLWDTAYHGNLDSAVLSHYDMVLWYTGFDWFQPITAAEHDALVGYLDNGGRLFLTSQDYLYHHQNDPLTKRYLGVLDYQESITPTVTYGGMGTLISDASSRATLDYTYQNFSDGLTPGPDSQVFLWHNRGMAAGIATVHAPWRSLFWSIPLESLPEKERAVAMNQVLGWLGDLGDSTFTTDQRIGPAGSRTYTLTVQSVEGAPTNQVTITNTLPTSLTLESASLEGALYHPESRSIIWQGELSGGQSHQIVYHALLDPQTQPGSRIDNSVILSYERHSLQWVQTVSTWLDTVDLTSSSLDVSTVTPNAGETVTYTALLHHQGTEPAQFVTATLSLPPLLHPLTNTLQVSSGEATLAWPDIHWQGIVQPGETITMNFALQVGRTVRDRWLPATLVVDDQRTSPTVFPVTIHLGNNRVYLPFIAQP